MITVILAAKIVLDGAAAAALAVSKNWPLALMFLGFVIADIGALWIA